jgi:hypothetical protein
VVLRSVDARARGNPKPHGIQDDYWSTNDGGLVPMEANAAHTNCNVGII